MPRRTTGTNQPAAAGSSTASNNYTLSWRRPEEQWREVE